MSGSSETAQGGMRFGHDTDTGFTDQYQEAINPTLPYVL